MMMLPRIEPSGTHPSRGKECVRKPDTVYLHLWRKERSGVTYTPTFVSVRLLNDLVDGVAVLLAESFGACLLVIIQCHLHSPGVV